MKSKDTIIRSAASIMHTDSGFLGVEMEKKRSEMRVREKRGTIWRNGDWRKICLNALTPQANNHRSYVNKKPQA